MNKRISDNLLAEFSRFVEANMGLSFPQEKRGDLERGIHLICAQSGADNEETFVRHVMSAELSKRQAGILAAGLTVGETYFFREKCAFDAFEHLVLARVNGIRHRTDRNLRIWSAGCASGEEPYSIAMKLKMLLPDLKEWNISILATDINPVFLEKAIKGVYTSWSFRDLHQIAIKRFFIKSEGSFEVVPEIKEMVTFSCLNLMKDDYPSLLNSTNAMDFIFCRNVLMYFAPEAIKSVARKFHRCLTDGGRLIVSQTELNDVYFQEFEKASQSGAMFFVKSDGRGGQQTDLTGIMELKIVDAPFPDVGVKHDSSTLPAFDLYPGKGKAGETVALPLHKVGNPAENAAELSQMARSCANQGLLDDALRYIEEAIRADNMNPGSHYLHAAILGEKGLKKEAMEALKKAVYLDADFALAYFAMGNLALGSGNMVEAERHFNSALLQLRRHGHDDILPESEGMTAGRLVELIEAMKWRKKSRSDDGR